MTEQRLTAEEILEDFRKGRISARMRDGLLRSEGYELRHVRSEEDAR